MPESDKRLRLRGAPAHERIILANLASALFTHKSIKTTEAKARRLRPLAEKLIGFAKRGDIQARRRILAIIHDKRVVHELLTEIAPRAIEREGSYTRINRIGPRATDNTPMAVIEIVLEPLFLKVQKAPSPRAAEPEKEAFIEKSSDQDESEDLSQHEGLGIIQYANGVHFASLATFPQAESFEDVQSIAIKIGIKIRHFGQAEAWTLGIKRIREDVDNPAILRIVRNVNGPGVEVQLAWRGAPVTPTALAATIRMLQSLSSNARRSAHGYEADADSSE
ncbi:50S ribosomal protein L17 [Rathayibacter sp. VKM Ac-2803]|uniref:50S ribosomal protein L17 n=1 Tax=Rathayibacter sp. VKM Ac-2803 TaxID=2609256 RepID=UPI00135B6C22|nr:50S ribosomal protein L17 [Rathayibacter sp. VKM Ac-2803]